MFCEKKKKIYILIGKENKNMLKLITKLSLKP
jgi:hypothetical protein